MALEIVERDENGTVHRTSIEQNGVHKRSSQLAASSGKSGTSINDWSSRVVLFLSKVFLPTGYPDSVTADYLPYQIYNALQAFCSSLATLVANRAVLEAQGVGNASASATDALLLTVLQDGCSRLATIGGAYYLGTVLYPEAKTYRLLADVFNDCAIVIDALTPFLSSYGAFLKPVALCGSGGLRALCGVAAGGSKASITNHFASPSSADSGELGGDVGDLNAKDGSKETVLALLGMLAGTLVIPYLTTPQRTYPALLFLITAHLALNYAGVRALTLRTLNRQRVSILWEDFRSRSDGKDTRCLSPQQVAEKEAIFNLPPDRLPTPPHSQLLRCTLGASLTDVHCSLDVLQRVVAVYSAERYLIVYDEPRRRLCVCFRDGWDAKDTLKAWVNALELARRLDSAREVSQWISCTKESLAVVNESFDMFVDSLPQAGWVEGSKGIQLMPGVPQTVLVDFLESKKSI